MIYHPSIGSIGGEVISSAIDSFVYVIVKDRFEQGIKIELF